MLNLTPVPGGTLPDLNIGTLIDDPAVGVIELARPESSNAFGEALWESFAKAVHALEAVETVRTLLICGQGRNFCAGIDVNYLQSMMRQLDSVACPGRMRERFRQHIMQLQEVYTSLERCRWPVIAAVQGACVGGGVDLITACDIRVCSPDATFCVKEVDLAITADLGTLQRLPAIVGHGAAADLALTARVISSQEALRLGLVTQVLGEDHSTLVEAAVKLARSVAAKSPLALMGTKRTLLHTRDSPDVQRGLEHVATYNAAMLLSEDLMAAVPAKRGRPPRFSRL